MSETNKSRKEFYENLRVLAAVSHGYVLANDIGVLLIKYDRSDCERSEIVQYCKENGITIINDEKLPILHHITREMATPKKETEMTEADRLRIEANVSRIQDIDDLQEKYEVLASSVLSEREKKILILRFGLDGKAPLNLQETGEVFHVSRERIRQIEAKALRKIRPRNGHYSLEELIKKEAK